MSMACCHRSCYSPEVDPRLDMLSPGAINQIQRESNLIKGEGKVIKFGHMGDLIEIGLWVDDDRILHIEAFPLVSISEDDYQAYRQCWRTRLLGPSEETA